MDSHSNSESDSTFTSENAHCKQLLTLDLPNENDPQTSRSTGSSQSTKMASLNPNMNEHNITTAPPPVATTSSGISNNNNNRNLGQHNNNFRIGSSQATGSATHSRIGSNSDEFYLGLYGWRKKCLYFLILSLAILIVVNLALTLWILKVMEFTTDGMGQLKIVPGGMQLNGQALFLDVLRASSIRSKHGLPITIESSKNFSINTRDYEGRLDNRLFLGHDKLEVLAHHFKVVDTHGTMLFGVNKNEVLIGANALNVEGEGGAVFRESIQTPLIRAEPGKELKLESPTRSLLINAGKDIFIKSGAGSIDASCLNDIRIQSTDGSIRLDSASILMPNLKIVQSSMSSTSSSAMPSMYDHHHQGAQHQHQSPSQHHHKIYQLCACSNGKLFLAMSHSICAGDESTVCR
ncbi:delta-sarcoglycan isoform X2 [Contarinia nasturtii]|uniref:delta-sarcoglycan isoform X2 n=1 Tax=Contarinia nasturtii TaxID=265458 RepID=UPI0012D3FE4B|nr:delta-sarcoglycan isoform X2 [Contarinia nasturtii]